MTWTLFEALIFPGFLFMLMLGLAMEFVDRKLYARLQNRAGPPWFQPLADLIKLSAKEEIIPELANPVMFKLMPVVALASVVAASFYIPLWNNRALLSFDGDLVVAAYLLTIPTLTFFLGGWHSTSLFSTIGATRTLTQLFAYEVPMFMALLAPALLAGAWSLTEMAAFYHRHPALAGCNVIGLLVALVALQGKLERAPFDIPEAETEIVGGAFTEYSGRLLALFRLAIDTEAVVGASLIAAVFLPFGPLMHPTLAFLLYLCKVLAVIAMLALMRTVLARLRIEQMVDFCWKIVAPAALLQLLVNLLLGGALPL